jgi:alanine-synthesizing transaminase
VERNHSLGSEAGASPRAVDSSGRVDVGEERTLRFSSRSTHDSTENALTVALAHVRREGRCVLDLTESNPTRAGIAYGLGVPEALGDARGTVYEPEPFGSIVARAAVSQALAEDLGVRADPRRLVLTSSTSEAYAFVWKLLCDAGDEVLVPAPSYPLLDHLARLEGVRLAPYTLAYDGEWHVDLASVRAARGARSRAVVLVHPNNPTGSYVKRDELDALGELGLPILSDEVFACYPLVEDPRRALSVLERTHGLVFALGGLSKMAALPQMKLAWIGIGGEPALADDAASRLELVADTFLSVGTPVQLAAPALLGSRHVARDQIRARLRANLANAGARVEGSPVSLLKVEGGWYATLRLPETRSEEDWALMFLREDGVFVHPGHFFDFASGAHVVLSLLTPEAAFDEGVARIVARVS